MADTDILEVFLKLSNPEVFDKIESLKKGKFEVDVTVKGDGQLREILAYNNKSIKLDVIANTDNAIKSLRDLETQMKGLQNLGSTKINFVGELNKDLQAVSQTLARLELQAKNINTVGISNAQVKAYQENPALLNQALRSFNTNQFSAPNSIQQPQLDSAIRAAQQRNVFNIENRNRGIEFFQKSDSVQLPLEQVKSFITNKQKDAFNQQVDIAISQLQEEAVQKYRAATNRTVGKFSPINQPEILKEQRSELFKELGLALIGGESAGQATGRLLGGLTGSAFGPGGTLLGAGLGGAAIEGASKSAEKLIEVFKSLAESGLSFNTSLLGISSILQATTNVTGPGGESVGIGEQLGFQNDRARSIQLLARRRLSSLGISGEKESTLVQAIISGAAQRGIQLDPEQVATISERLGGTIQAQRPELLGNTSQLRRDIEDLLAGLPQRTVLGSLVKSFAPNIGRANTAEELVRATNGLSSFPNSLRNSSENPVVAFQKFNATIDQLNTFLGDKLVRALAPGIDRLANKLADEKFISALDKATEGLVNFAKGVDKIQGSYEKLLQSGATAAGEATGFNKLDENQQKAVASGARGILLNALGLGAVDIPFAIGDAIGSNKEAKSKLSASLKASTLQNLLFGQAGLDNFEDAANVSLKGNGLAQLALNNLAFGQEGRREGEAIDTLRTSGNLLNIGSVSSIQADSLRNRLGFINNQEVGLRNALSQEQDLFDTSSPLGKLQAAQAQLPFLQKLTQNALARENVTNTDIDGLRKSLLPNGFLVSSPEKQVQDQANSVIKAETAVRQATEERIKALNEERAAISQVAQLELDRSKVLRDSSIDTSTAQGRLSLIQSNKLDFVDRGNAARSRLSDLQAELGLSTNDIDRQNIQAQIESETIRSNQAQVGLIASGKAEETANIDITQGFAQAALNLDNFSRSVAEATARSQELADQVTKSTQALSDFDEDAKLRGLGDKGRQVAAAEKLIKARQEAGDITPDIGIPPEISNLVKGSFSFNPLARARFEEDQAQGEFDVVTRERGRRGENDAITRRGLVRSRDEALKSLEQLPLLERLRKINELRGLTNDRQQGFGIFGQDEAIEQLKDPTNFSRTYGEIGSILGGPAGIPTDISSGLFNSDGSPAQSILNSSDVTNKGGSPFYSAIVGGLQDSKLRNNIRPQAPAYYNEQTPGGIPFGGSKVTTESSILPAIKELIDTVKQQGDKTADDIRKGIESSFGGK